MPTLEPKKILIAPLDWGLGHIARCIPLVRYIRSLGHIPIVAGNVSQQSFIRETFENIDYIHLPGYNITYSKWNRFRQAGLLFQLPGICKTINDEHKWLMELSRNLQIDGIISDNRYGLFHSQIPSVIMTHQLLVQSGNGSAADRMLQKIHYSYLQRFNNVWVVDNLGIPNLAGNLSQTRMLPRGTKYIGLLSRFENAEKESLAGDNLLILLSGLEPQRSILSGMLRQQLQYYSGRVIFIEGSESAIPPPLIPPHITYHKRLTDQYLTPLLRNAGMVVCRSGYSTLMDLVAVQKKAILIPTPGQTEQEYLARYLNDQGIFYAAKQDSFHLETALKEAQQFPFHFPDLGQAYGVYKKVVMEWIEAL